ncbi:MAG TPA: tetratricopeptide repeat protein [Drouetiella sp.]
MQISSKLRTAIACLSFTTLFGLACIDARAVGGKTDAPSLRSIAFEHYLNGDQDAALDYYQKAIDSASREYGPQSSYIAQLYYEMGTLALDAKKFTHAEGYLRQAVQHNPNSVMSRVKYAECLQIKGKPDEALAQIRAALVKHSNSPEAREALVSWLNANKKTANAIHESYNLSVAAKGTTVPVPAAMMVATAPKKEEVIASAAAPTPAPVVVPKNSPIKTFAWTDSKKKQEEQQKKAEEEKKAAEAKKKAEEEEKKAAEERKKAEAEIRKQQDKKSRQDKAKKDKSKKGSKGKQQSAPSEMVAQEPALRTTANRIKSKKEEGELPSVTMAPSVPQPILVGKQGKPRSGSMVPPPPPTVPNFGFPGFGGFQPPPPSQFAKPPKPAVAKKPKAAAPAPKAEAPEKPAPAASSGEGEDPDFLLQWSGANEKKKKGK